MGPCKSGTRRTGEQVGTLGTHEPGNPGGGVQPRRQAPGLGEPRRGSETVGRDATRAEKQEARSARPARVPGRA